MLPVAYFPGGHVPQRGHALTRGAHVHTRFNYIVQICNSLNIQYTSYVHKYLRVYKRGSASPVLQSGVRTRSSATRSCAVVPVGTSGKI